MFLMGRFVADTVIQFEWNAARCRAAWKYSRVEGCTAGIPTWEDARQRERIPARNWKVNIIYNKWVKIYYNIPVNWGNKACKGSHTGRVTHREGPSRWNRWLWVPDHYPCPVALRCRACIYCGMPNTILWLAGSSKRQSQLRWKCLQVRVHSCLEMKILHTIWSILATRET